MPKLTLSLTVFLISAQVQAAVLDGEWLRVADGCHELSKAQVLQLPASGGTNTMQRRMNLDLSGERFVSTSIGSLKCDPDFIAHGPDLQTVHLYCGGEVTNEGSLTIVNDHHLILVADHFADWEGNPWGVLFRHWDYRRSGEVLILQSPQSECESGTYTIYFVLAPTT